MTFDKIQKELNNKIYRPIYLLMGDEPYFIDKITNHIMTKVLREDERDFNQVVMYGKDVDVGNLDNMARRYPMMANHQVLIVKEAQNLKNIENLVYYAGNPLKSTILVINYKYKTIDKRKKLYKEIEKNGVILESKKLYENKIPAWINDFLKEKGFSLSPSASALLTEHLGTELSKISNELEKLALNLPAGTNITPEHIEKNIGISKDFNNFELQNALIKKDAYKANLIINYFGSNQKEHPIIVTVVTLFNFFSKLLMYHFIKTKNDREVASIMKVNPFFLKDYKIAAKKYNTKKTAYIISVLREYDVKSKGIGNVSAQPIDLLKEMIFKILH